VADFSSVLVVRLSSLGDVLFALPAVEALLASGVSERVSWLVEDRAELLVRPVEGLHEVLVFPRRNWLALPAHALALRRRRDDVVLDLQGNSKSRLQLLCLRSPRKLGFDAPLAKEGSQRALSERFLPAPHVRHRIAVNLAILGRLGVRVPQPVPRPALALGRDDPGLPPGAQPLVVLHPGTSAFGAFKRWAPERFAELGDRLVERCGARLLITGGPAEQDLVSALRGALASPALAPPPGGLSTLAGVLRRAALVVASDSLPLHLANALGTPVVGLYGPKDPRATGPFFDRSRVVRAGVACSPCTLRRCHDRLCMQRLTVDAVFDAALELLGGAA